MIRMHPTLSVLDATVRGPGISSRQALQWTTEIAQMAENAGFHRFWVVEHHGIPDIGGCAPSVLMAHLAAVTKQIRIGSGGVMLPNHAPYRIAEEFSMLEALHPGRIDLGLGRAGGSNPTLVKALRRAPGDDAAYVQQLDELDAFLHGGFSEDDAFASLKRSLPGESPPQFLLGSGMSSATMAAERGMAFAFAHHLAPEKSAAGLAAYRKLFRGNESQPDPYAIATVAVVCADTPEAAEQAALRMSIIRLRRGLTIQHGLTVPDEVLLYPEWSTEEIEIAQKQLTGGWIVVGDPDTVRKGLLELQKTTGADELMLTTMEHDGPARVRTLKTVARAFQLAKSQYQ